MNDERFERELRGFLAARAPKAVSPAFRARLHAVSTEPPVGAGAMGGWLGGAGRTLVGAATVAVAAVVVFALLTRPEVRIIRDPSTVGGPSVAPTKPTAPFVIAPSAFFSAAAVGDADRRLGALFLTSGIEGRFIVQAVTSAAELSTPAGWPDSYRADASLDTDVTAILGVAPDGTVTCCLTITGPLIDRAREEGYWRPASWPERLEGDLESDDPAIRDAALDRFVRGIEALEPGIAMTRVSMDREATLREFVTLVIGVGLLAALALWTRARWSMGRTRLGNEGLVEGAAAAAAAGTGSLHLEADLTATRSADIGAVDSAVADPSLASAAPVGWAPADPNVVPRDRSLLTVAAVAIAGLLGLGLWDLVRPSSAPVPFDMNAEAIGLASPTLPFVPVTLLAIAVLALLLVARNGARRRRLAIGGLMLLVGLGGWLALDGARPTPGSSWIAGVGAGAIDRGGGGLFDAQTYPLQPEEPFTFGMTIRNGGALPMTILGLDRVQSTQPNPYVAAIVGVGSVEAPTEQGYVLTLSARPEDATVAWPLTLAPGHELGIVLLGRAGACAEPGGPGSNLPFLQVQLTHRVLGIERSEAVGLPVALFVPSKSTCTVEVPGGTVTYGE